MSETGIFAVIGIIVVFIFVNVVELIWINDEIKSLKRSVERLDDMDHHHEFREDYIFEKVSGLVMEIKKIKGQIFTVDEEGENK